MKGLELGPPRDPTYFWEVVDGFCSMARSVARNR